jgi:hypothetical protein
MPDILNMATGALYEIRPVNDAAGALAKATQEVETFNAAGMPVHLGAIGAPGTYGIVPGAWGGYNVFWSPTPGVIVYQYSRSTSYANGTQNDPSVALLTMMIFLFPALGAFAGGAGASAGVEGAGLFAPGY